MFKDPISGQWRPTGPPKLLVAPSSATYGRRQGVIFSIDADHSTMIKFAASDIDIYPKVLSSIREYIEIANDVVHARFNSLSDSGLSISQGQVVEIYQASRSGFSRSTTKESQERKPRSLYHIPFLQNRKSTGRKETLERLEKELFAEGTLALVGLGGVSKTQVELQFAYSVKEKYSEYSIWWIPAASLETFEQAYVEIQRGLGDRLRTTKDDLKHSIRRYFETEAAGKWLFIMDNADNKDIIIGTPSGSEGLLDYIPKSENGLVLYTTRSRELAYCLSGTSIIDLQQMDSQEAQDFLAKSLINKGLPEDKAEIMELAISQAAAYLNIHRVSIRRYLELLGGAEQDTVDLLSREFHDNTRYRASQNAVASTWLLSFDQIHATDNHASSLLSFISCIKPKAIPHSILPKASSNENLEHAVGTLCGWRAYLPHTLRMIEGSDECQTNDKYNNLFRAGQCLGADRRFKEAVKAFEAVLNWRRQQYAEDHTDILDSEHQLAAVYDNDRQADKALPLLKHVFNIRRKTLAEDDPSLLSAGKRLASAYLDKDQITDALALLERNLITLRRTCSEENEILLCHERKLEFGYSKCGRHIEAVRLLQQIVAIEEKTFPADDHGALGSKCSLASAYHIIGRIAEAIELLEHVVEVGARTLAEDNHDRLSSEYGLASAYLTAGRINEATVLI
ncbi:hypothetical protein MMC25_007764 [Agyrium rufum]|nr:hypothetical protein [Agyrium rufum]